MKILYQNVKLPACSTGTIASSKDIFSYIDSDFKSYDADEKLTKTKKTEVAVLEMEEDMTFADMFGEVSKDTESLCLTQAQIIEFVKEHKDKLRTEGYATFFPFKFNGEVFVAGVLFDDGGSLEVRVRRFSCDGVWSAEYRLRFVVPQLALKSPELTPSPSDNMILTLDGHLEAAIAIVKKAGYIIYKQI